MSYLSPKERMKVSLRREEVEATGKPFYTKYADVPKNLYSKSQCQKMGDPIKENEAPYAYVLNRQWLGYLPLYKRYQEEARR